MKSIAFVSTMISVPWGGSEDLWAQTAENLLKKEYRIYINVKQWSPPASKIKQLEQQGCYVTHRPFYTHKPLWRKVADLFFPSRMKFSSFYEPIKYLNTITPDLVVICQGSNQDGLEWMEACNDCNFPYVTISQACSEALWPDDITSMKMLQLFQGAAWNYFISNRNLKLTEIQMGGLLNNVTVVRNPFNVPYNSRLKWPAGDEIKLACVGRIQPDAKGQDLLIEVLRSDKWKNRNISVTLFGHGPNVNSLKRLKDVYQLNNLHFGGFVNDVSQIWEIHQALILPSRYEGLPLAVVEAMLSARICIVTDVAGNREVIDDGENGFIAASPNALHLDQALERAWQKRGEWEAMGLKAQVSIKNNIPAEPASEFANLLEKHLNNNGL